jgi:hypothetical protein
MTRGKEVTIGFTDIGVGSFFSISISAFVRSSFGFGALVRVKKGFFVSGFGGCDLMGNIVRSGVIVTTGLGRYDRHRNGHFVFGKDARSATEVVEGIVIIEIRGLVCLNRLGCLTGLGYHKDRNIEDIFVIEVGLMKIDIAVKLKLFKAHVMSSAVPSPW